MSNSRVFYAVQDVGFKDIGYLPPGDDFKHIPPETNCKNCGAALKPDGCEYCGTGKKEIKTDAKTAFELFKRGIISKKDFAKAVHVDESVAKMPLGIISTTNSSGPR